MAATREGNLGAETSDQVFASTWIRSLKMPKSAKLGQNGEIAMSAFKARTICGSILLAVAAIGLSAPVHADNLPDLNNGWDPPPPSVNPTAYELDFYGDVTSVIPAQVTDDTVINPFAWANHDHGAAVNPTVVFYDSGANLTRIVMSGDPLPNPVPSNYPYYYYSNGVKNYHAGTNRGFNYSRCSMPPTAGDVCLVSRHWSDGVNTQELDALTLSWDGKKGKGRTQWVLIYVGTSDPKTKKEHSGFWELRRWDPTGGNKFDITNASGMSYTIDRLGYIDNIPGPTDPDCQQNPTCDQNERILDVLNVGEFPPPGDDGSHFVNIPVKKMLKPGKAYKFTIE